VAACNSLGKAWDYCAPFNWHPTCILMNGASSDTITEDERPPCLGELSKSPCAFPYVLEHVTLNECTDANNGNGRLPGRTWCPLLVDANLEPEGQPGTHVLREGGVVFFIFFRFCSSP
jgi:hypothetical protein